MTVRWRRAVLWLVGFACLWLPALDDPPLTTGPCLREVTVSSAVLAIVTASPSLATCQLTDPRGAVVASWRSPVVRRRHTATFAELNPGQDYGYSIEIDGGVRYDGRFRTASTDDQTAVRFAFLGDSGAQPWWVWLQNAPALYLPARWGWFPCADAVSRVGAQVAGFQPDFVLHLGDVVYPWGRHAQYSAGFFRPFAEVLRSAPIHAVLGNHDLLDLDGLQLLANLGSAASDVTGDGRFFSVARGPVRVIGLDCNADRTGRRFDESHPGFVYLRRELAAATEPWVVVASHFPMRTQSRQTHDRADLLLHLLPELQRHRASLYLAGHDHCYQRFGTPENGELPLVVSGGGGKDLYAVRPSARAVRLASIHHWCGVETTPTGLVVVAHGIDGSTVDRFVVPLAEGSTLAALRLVNPARAARIDRLRAR